MPIHPSCGHCGGSGKVTYQGKKYECPVCHGHGKLLDTTIVESKEKPDANTTNA